MKKLWISLFTSVLLSSTLSHGIIYRVSRWSHLDRKVGGEPQELNLFYDWHVDLPDGHITRQQYTDIASREKKASRIVEDMSDACTHLDQRVRKLRAMMQKDTPKKNLAGQVIKIDPKSDSFEPCILTSPTIGLTRLNSTYNVEWRHAFGLGTTDEESVLFGQIFSKDFHGVIREIAAYDDGPILNAYYQSILSPFLTDKNDIKPISAPFDEVVEITSPLLDARAIHTLYNISDEPVVDIVAGGAHCEDIEPILQKIGYQKMVDIQHPDVDYEGRVLIPVNIRKILDKPIPPLNSAHEYLYSKALLVASYAQHINPAIAITALVFFFMLLLGCCAIRRICCH